jgi:hypothetical protein
MARRRWVDLADNNFAFDEIWGGADEIIRAAFYLGDGRFASIPARS